MGGVFFKPFVMFVLLLEWNTTTQSVSRCKYVIRNLSTYKYFRVHSISARYTKYRSLTYQQNTNLQNTHLPSIRCSSMCTVCVIIQAVSRRPVTSEAQIHSQASLFVIYDGQSDSGTRFCPSTMVWISHYHFTQAPYT
jgi:hypothetical protein